MVLSSQNIFLQSMSADLYAGIPHREMIRKYKGETVYNSEIDRHFPHLTVRQTLEFAATMRAPRNSVLGATRKDHVEKVTAVAMVSAIFWEQNYFLG